MAVYKLFPNQDSTIYSEFPTTNAGLSEILQVSAYPDVSGKQQSSRILVEFDVTEINNLINGQITSSIQSGSYQAFLRLFIADASTLPSSYSLEVYPISGSWEMGLGRIANNPPTTLGVSWDAATLTRNWVNPGGDTGSIINSASFGYQTSKDLQINVTQAIVSGSVPNGFLIKFPTNFESQSAADTFINYFSVDTHTIYPPALEFRWSDSFYTSSLPLATNDQTVVTLANNAPEFSLSSVQQFRVNSRPRYPVRQFQTSSIYLNATVLPTSSYWSIKDLDTDDIVVDFDPIYTKLSADNNGNYFTVYMAGLEPERYYKVLIKTIFPNGETIVFDNNNYFKVNKDVVINQ